MSSNAPVPAIVLQAQPSSPGAEDLEAIGDGASDSLPLLGPDDDAEARRGIGPGPGDSPLLAGLADAHDEHPWVRPKNFGLVQLALMSNVFLYGLDGTITAATYAVISSEFGATNMASWLTTSYLITSTAFQPLYGRLSDLFGRRICFFLSTASFAAGCLGCGLAPDMVLLNCMRALAGFGGGGLMTMATIVNSDMIPFKKRGMYQAMQNGFAGFGAICGASLGGAIADTIGWRWTFLLQVPIAAVSFSAGYLVITDPSNRLGDRLNTADPWKAVDFSGALLLVAAVSLQLLGLSLGGNDLPWSSPWVLGALAVSLALFGLFIRVEGRTRAIPMIPLRMLRGKLPVLTQTANVCAGTAAYAYLFALPLYFQVVLLDSPTVAGARMVIPSLGVPIGGLMAGVVMSRWGRLLGLVRVGALLMVIGNGLIASFQFQDSAWKYFVYVFPANVGQGLIFPGLLFTSLATFEHADHAVSASTVYLIRSLGAVWGVSITSAIIQTTLSHRLPDVLGDVPDKWKVIDDVRHSIEALHQLPPDAQLRVRQIYYDGLHYSFSASAGVAAVAFCAAMVAREKGLRKTNH